ncbi:MAG: tetratricopeptide repeat protein, partial [Candidatus Promineifilaceae bacterium]|nr:tetratricopeptide repeat protein [Candidatus Promineifilaceae bacterium]
MESKLSRLCDGLLEAGWLAAILAVPLFFNIHSERVFEPDKLTLLRSIAVFMAFVMLVRFVERRSWTNLAVLSWRAENSIWRTPFVLPVATLMLVYFISTIFSITPRVSWAGSYQRLQGTYSTLSYVIVLAAAATTIRSRIQIGRVVTAVIVTSIPVSFYGLLQHFGLDPLPWGGDVEARVAGHMGNAIFIAAYLIMAVPLTLGRIIDAFTNILSDEQLSYADVLRSAIYIFALAIQMLAIYWSGSRGPLIGLAVGLFSFILVLLVSLRNVVADQDRFHWRDLVYAIGLIAPAIIALLLSGLIGRLTSPFFAFAVFFGLVGLTVIVILVFVASRRGWKWLWLSWLLLTLFIASWLLVFNIPSNRMASLQNIPLIGSVFEAQLDWKELPNIGSYGRMLDPSQTSGREKSNRVRVLIWEGVVELIRPHDPMMFPDGKTDTFNFLRPLIGYGPESMYVVYNRFYPAELATVEARNASPDRSHNETFDALVITGLAGFLAWQALYVSVFYFGFKFLGVVGTRRDRSILIGLWIGGALLGAFLALAVLGPIYLGVAIPTGTIVGLVGYLFYYALFARGNEQDLPQENRYNLPFQTDRLLMNALLAAVLVHYVEIHFGIAVAATRLYFFLYVGLMYLISYKLPRAKAIAEDSKSTVRRKRSPKGRKSRKEEAIWGPILLWTLLLALLVGILGFEFTNFVLTPDQAIETGADLATRDIFLQSFFVNAQKGFLDSPFVYLMIVISWALGSLLILSEMVKQRELVLGSSSNLPLSISRRNFAVGLLILMAILGLVMRFLFEPASASASLGRSLALLGSVICLWAAVLLVRNNEQGHFVAIMVSAAGLVLVLPVVIAGGWIAATSMLILCAITLYLLWNRSWNSKILPPMVLGITSLLIGLLYTLFHATLLREALLYLLFFQGIEPISPLFELFFRASETIESIPELRVLEAKQSMRFLTFFYIYLFSLVISAGFSIAWKRIKNIRIPGSTLGYVTAVIAFIIAVVAIGQTNVRVVQADMVYKRGRPYDNQAMNQNDPLNWDITIAIYEEALDLAPLEDFYYLFLGRALLERSTIGQEDVEQRALLSAAEQGLLKAQSINPLNTDHTANLARLNTRWAVLSPNNEANNVQLEAAEKYYQRALALSPQNSIIRNEYARYALELKRDCDQAIALYNESLAVDPFFDDTYFALTDAYVTCASAQINDDTQRELYELAAKSITNALERQPANARAW